MNLRNLSNGAALFALATALIPAQAAAEDRTDSTDELAIEARGSFAGFRMPHSAAIEIAGDIASAADYALVPRSVTGALVPPTPELIVRDDVGIVGSVDTQNTLPSVVQIFLRNNVTNGTFFNCTGTLINPRTVLTAAHCLNSASSETYGLAGSAPTTVWISTGVDSSIRLFNTIGNTSRGYDQGGVARSTDVIIHPSANLGDGALEFPWADVALVALDKPVTDVPSMPLLLTPLDRLTHVLVAGYGTNGTGDTGGTNAGNRFLRRVGENMLGLIGSNADFIDGVFSAFTPSAATLGVETQTMYWIDFDDPTRTAADKAGCTFTGTNISCTTLDAVKAIDFFPGDALPREAGTAPGDSGSPIIVDQLYAFPVVAGVLSGGYDFFGTNNRYGDVSFYNPLFPFFEFISQNTPYKYVSAKAGNGLWSDAQRWTQDLDPGFFIDDGTGKLVNGIPSGSEPGVYSTGPKLGTTLADDASDNEAIVSPLLPPEGTFNFGGNLPVSSALLGPGSTGFVPDNTDGIVGTSFANPAQYFDVLLLNPGTTTVDMDVEIDRLTIDGKNTGFDLPTGFEFTSLIGVEQYNGLASVDGTLNAGNVLLFGGTFGGNGTVSTNAFFNVSGIVSPGGDNAIGTLTIIGEYVQTSGGALLADVRRAGSNGLSFDQLVVSGGASLAGDLLVKPTGQITAKYGASWTVLTAGSILGNFDRVSLLTRSPVLFAGSRVEGNEVVVEIGANPISQLVGSGSGLSSLANVLDTLRFSGRYADFASVFGVVDSAGFESFGQTLAGLTPTSGFQQTFSATSFAQRFTGQVAQRTLKLRGADGAASGFSAAGNAGFAQAGAAPAEAGKLGFFGSVSGSYLEMARDDQNTGETALERAAFSEAGELTLGMDYRISDKVVIGVAMSNIRDSASRSGAFGPLENQSDSAAVYAATSFGDGFADGYFGFADQSYSTSRAALGNAIGAFDAARGHASGSQTFAGVRIGHSFEAAQGLRMGPVASVDYVRSSLGRYRELGAGGFGLEVDARRFTSIGAKLGGMAAADLTIAGVGKVKAYGSVAYARELGAGQDLVTARFVGASDLPFSIARQIDTQWVAVNAGAELAVDGNLSARASITSDIGRGSLTNNQGNVSLAWRF